MSTSIFQTHATIARLTEERDEARARAEAAEARAVERRKAVIRLAAELDEALGRLEAAEAVIEKVRAEVGAARYDWRGALIEIEALLPEVTP